MENEAVTKKYERALRLPFYGSLNVIRKLCGQNRDILDVGCASGYLGKILLSQGNRVYGIDGNNDAVALAKGFYNDALCLDLNHLPQEPIFSGKKFDVIVFADVLEHVLDPESVLRYFGQFLKPTGKIIVSLPNVALWRVRLNLLFGKFDYTDYGVLDRTHLHLYTFKSARILLENAGYTVSLSRSAMNLYFFGIATAIFPFLRSLLSIHIIMSATESPVEAGKKT